MAFVTNFLNSFGHSEFHNQIFHYTKRNQIKQIQKLLKYNQGLLHEEYKSGKSVLESICSHHFTDDLQEETVNCLFDHVRELELNPNPQYGYKSLIHFAVIGHNPTILEKLIKKFPKQLKQTAERNTALHTMIKEVTPINYLLFCKCLAILVKSGIDLQARDKQNKTAIEYAQMKHWEDQLILKLLNPPNPLLKLQHNQQNEEKTLKKSPIDYIQEKNEDGFIRHFVNNQDNLKTLHEYLPHVVEQNLLKIIDFMIENNAIVIENNETHPLVMAKEKHHHQMIERLLQAPGMIVPSDILFRFIKRIDARSSDESDDNIKCYQLLLSHHGTDVNLLDADGNSVLHYAAKYGKWDVLHLLLDSKASLANCNKIGQLAIADVKVEVLRGHFDSCIHLENAYTFEDNLMLAFDYSTIISSKQKKYLPQSENQSLETLKNTENFDLDKNSIVLRLDCDENTKLSDITSNYLNVNEMSVILHLCNDLEKRQLLLHPLINTFIHAKWHRIETFALINLIVYIFYCFSLGVYLVAYSTSQLSVFFLIFTLLILTIRELFQLFVGRLSYFKDINNYIELLMIFDVFLMLVTGGNVVEIKVMAALLSALAYLSMLGNLPRIAAYVNMFRRVTMHCCKVLCVFFALILAFAYCFHALISFEVKNDEFKDYPSSLFKTLVMLTGEYDIGSFTFENHLLLLRFMLVLFIFVMSVVLMNLLIALAFADIQQMKKDAILNELHARVQYIAQAERWLYAEQKLSNVYLNSVFRMMISLQIKGCGLIQAKKQENGGVIRGLTPFCFRCFSRTCRYQIDKKMTRVAKEIATKNTK